jgi:hypothetical protein
VLKVFMIFNEKKHIKRNKWWKKKPTCVIEVKVLKSKKHLSNNWKYRISKKGGQCEDCDKWASHNYEGLKRKILCRLSILVWLTYRPKDVVCA